jgi:hypothetical protein
MNIQRRWKRHILCRVILIGHVRYLAPRTQRRPSISAQLQARMIFDLGLANDVWRYLLTAGRVRDLEICDIAVRQTSKLPWKCFVGFQMSGVKKCCSRAWHGRPRATMLVADWLSDAAWLKAGVPQHEAVFLPLLRRLLAPGIAKGTRLTGSEHQCSARSSNPFQGSVGAGVDGRLTSNPVFML